MSEVFGIDELRGAVALANNSNETFNQRFTAEELIKLYRAYAACGWDFPPAHWQERQVKEALAGKVPKWDDMEEPFYG